MHLDDADHDVRGVVEAAQYGRALPQRALSRLARRDVVNDRQQACLAFFLDDPESAFEVLILLAESTLKGVLLHSPFGFEPVQQSCALGDVPPQRRSFTADEGAGRYADHAMRCRVGLDDDLVRQPRH